MIEKINRNYKFWFEKMKIFTRCNVYMNMNVPRPGGDSYTIYSKSGCLYCTKAKVLLQNERVPPLFVNCDKFLLENKEEFFDLMKSLIGYEYKTFPIIFKNGRFIGGYNKTKDFYEESKIVARGDF